MSAEAAEGRAPGASSRLVGPLFGLVGVAGERLAAAGPGNLHSQHIAEEPLQPGDIDQYVRPQELVAIEVYHGSQAPPQFTPPGQSSCASIVAWTVARVRPDNNATKRKP